MAGRPAPVGWPGDQQGDAPAADADGPPVLRADHRVGLAGRAAPQPGHRRGHPEEARAAAEVPRRPRRGQADGRGPGQRRPARPARRRAAGPHRHAGRGAGRPGRGRGRADRRPGTGCGSRSASSATTGTCPLHPDLVSCSAAWTAANLDHIRAHKRLVADHRGPLDRHLIGRIVRRVAAAAGVPGVHPHRLRHTLATQAINRGMRLEAIAALLGHQKMEMTLIYAKIANRVVADEYAAVSAKIDALYGQPPELPADYETTGMARLRREAHARMLGNGLCTRPAELDCRLESACETCAYFRTGTQFLPILTRQRDHAHDHGQADRAALFDGLIQRAANSNGAEHHAPDHPRPRRRRPNSPKRSPSSPTGYPAARNRPSRRAWPPSSATPPTASTPSAPTCTGSSSSSASATAKNSSASQRHDHQRPARRARLTGSPV